MFRAFKTINPCNPMLFLIIIGLILSYLLYLFEFIVAFNPNWKWIASIIQTILFIILCWTFLQVYLTQPGIVPKFYALQPQSYLVTQQRRFCTICHNFKPERTHHCSVCGKCVLNMDHHCPWINNCVGFYNRKFFILFLLYLAVNLVFATVQEGYLITNELIIIFKGLSLASIHTGIRILVLIFHFVLFSAISIFAGYHLQLVLLNKTTLSELIREDRKKKGYSLEINVYDIGPYNNFIQVFGKKPSYWFFPLIAASVCNGLDWPKNTPNNF